MGQLLLQMVRNSGAAKIIHIDKNPSRLMLAKQYGATDIVNAAETDVSEAVMEITHGKGADIVIEAAGSIPTFETALAIASKIRTHCAVWICAGRRQGKHRSL